MHLQTLPSQERTDRPNSTPAPAVYFLKVSRGTGLAELASMLRDIVCGHRILRKCPKATAVTILALALVLARTSYTTRRPCRRRPDIGRRRTRWFAGRAAVGSTYLRVAVREGFSIA